MRTSLLPAVALLAACDPAPATADADTDTDTESPADTQVSTTPRLRFLAVDRGREELVYVDEIGGGGWSTPLPAGPRDLAILGDSAVLVSHNSGYQRVALADGTLGFRVDGYANVQSVASLANGNLMLARQVGDDAALIEIDAEGTEVSTTTVQTAPAIRFARPTADDTTLITTGPPWRVREVDADGGPVWSAALPGPGSLAVRAIDGTTWANTGDDLRVVALDDQGAITDSVGTAEAHPALGLASLGGFHRLADGTIVVAHEHAPTTSTDSPHLVAFSADNEVRWTWRDPTHSMVITQVLVLDARW